MRTIFAVAVVLAACGGPTSAPQAPTPSARTLRYQILFGERVAGAAELTIEADGGRIERYRYNDRGRGPDLRSRMSMSAKGLPTSLHVEGVDYYKKPVTESLQPRGGVVRWRSLGEQGEAPVDSGFYVRSSESVDFLAAMFRAVRVAPGQRLRLHPAGELRIEAEVPLEVVHGGAKRRIAMVALIGLGYDAATAWVDEHGELFADVSTWSSTVLEGAEVLVPELLAIEQRWRSERARRLAATLARVPQGGLAVTHARLFDPASKAMRDDVTIVVAADRITAVGPSASTTVPAGAEVIDARGKTVIPGLWDMHVHTAGSSSAMRHIAAGVTTVRDLGSDVEELAAHIDRYDRGEAIGPRVLRAGLIDTPGPFVGPTELLVSTPDEARAVVNRLADLGYPQVKIYSSVSPALVSVLVEAAHARGLRVSGHVPFGMTARDAVEAGFDELQHVNFLFLNFLASRSDDTRTPLRFTRVGDGAGSLDLSSPQVHSFVELLRARRTVVDPTLGAFENLFVDREGEVEASLRAVAARLPAQVQRGARGGGLPVTADNDARYRAAFEACKRMVKLLWDRGVPLVAGTDGPPGFGLHRELELWVEAGIPPAAVLAQATLGAARVMGKDRELGSIEVGKGADLVILGGDPLVDMAALRRTEIIVSRGRIHRADDVYRALGIAPATAAAR